MTWICHGCSCVPHPEPPSHLPPHPIPLGHPSASTPSTLSHASNLDWQSISLMIIYMFQCYSPKSSHPRPLPQSPKDCSVHPCLFCCLTYGVIVTIFLDSIYADDTNLMAESEEELKSLLMKVKVESGKSWLKAQHSENEDHGIWSHHFMGNRWGNSGNSVRLYCWGLQNH